MLKHRDAIEKLLPYIPGKPIDDVKKEYGLTEVVKIASNENPYGCSEYAKKAVITALSDPQLYPDGNCRLLREALVQKYNTEENIQITGENIVFGCGTDEVISMIGKVYVNEGDECITGETTFSQYAASVESMGGKMVYTPMKDYGFDLNAMLSKITDRTKAIFIANPNNPTGTAYTNEAQLAFLKKVPSDILVVIDEAYAEFADIPDFPMTLQHMQEFKNIIYLKTFSKAYGLASMRVGFGIADAAIIELFERIRNPFNVPVPAQVAAVEAVRDNSFIQSTVQKNHEVLQFVSKEFEAMGLFYIPSQANFIMVDTKKDSRTLFVELMKKGYIIRAGAAFGMDTFIRVSLGTMEQMKGFIKVLKDFI